jgi:hypothetical protein
VARRFAGPSAALYTGTDRSNAGVPSVSNTSPWNVTSLPPLVSSLTSLMASWARRTGRSYASPWMPSTALVWLGPTPRMARPSESRWSVAPAIASIAGVRE